MVRVAPTSGRHRESEAPGAGNNHAGIPARGAAPAAHTRADGRCRSDVYGLRKTPESPATTTAARNQPLIDSTKTSQSAAPFETNESESWSEATGNRSATV